MFTRRIKVGGHAGTADRRPLTSLASYIGAVVAVALAGAGTLALRGWMGTSVTVLFFPAVISAAVYGGYGPALLATLLSTGTLAFFFIPPYYSFDIGPDDLIRLTVFTMVALVTASISSAQKRAEEAQRKALDQSRGALNTLRKVSGWPLFVDVSVAGAAAKLLAHAAGVVGSACAVAVWEAEDEPWVYVATSHAASPQVETAGESPEPSASQQAGGAITKYAPDRLSPLVPPELETAAFVSEQRLGDRIDVAASERGRVITWQGVPVHADIAARLPGQGVASAPFEVEHLHGRMFFSDIEAATPELIPLVEVVAHEVGNSLERLHLHDRLQQIAIREDRIRVARDLHDGVLQSLTGIRFQLQALAGERDAPPAISDRLLAVERAIAIEQRELRLFIEDLKPVARPAKVDGAAAHALEDMRARLVAEWNTPIALRITPQDLALPAATERALRLMLREAIVNALKHAHPSRVSVEVDAVDRVKLRAIVSNDGRGFQFRGRLEHADLAASNAGPVSLRERLASLGGSLAIESSATGSRVEMTLPL